MAGTDIEKKSLEAHVELCAERYENLDTKLNSLESRMDRLEGYLVEIKNSLVSNKSEASDSSGPYKTMIAIGTTMLGALIGALVTLIVHIK
jgi:chromosome segregation ATPase